MVMIMITPFILGIRHGATLRRVGALASLIPLSKLKEPSAENSLTSTHSGQKAEAIRCSRKKHWHEGSVAFER